MLKKSDNSAIQIPQGFYTFSDLKTYLKEKDITIEKTLDNKVKLNSSNDLNLRIFGQLLGFEKDKDIDKNTDYVSLYSMNLSNNLREIEIYCSLIDENRNFTYDIDGIYKNSNLLASFSIDTEQSLNGSFSHFHLRNEAFCENFSGQEFSVDVKSGGHVFDYEIFLDILVE